MASDWNPKDTLESLGIGDKSGAKRSLRVAEAIREELATLLISKLRDPRLRTAHISRVEVSDDISVATIYYTVIGSNNEIQAAGTGFTKAKGFMRTHLAKTLNLRFTPALHFRYDKVADKVSELEDIFQEIENERSSRKKNP